MERRSRYRKSQPPTPHHHPSTVPLTILSPLVLPPDLILLLRREIIRNIESLPDLLGALALNHIRHGLAADIEERLDVQVVGG